MDEVSQTIKTQPDWRYLLAEFYELYRQIPAGGSPRIRSHQRQAREAISRVIKAGAELRLQTAAQKPVTAHLRRALDQGRSGTMASIIRSLDCVADSLSWQYGYEKVPPGLTGTYAYAEIAGPQGPVVTTEIILGVVLFAPGCTYPAHAHQGITESYVCLSGAVSENHQGVYVPGSMIFNPPDHLHRITVGDREPALLAYAWLGKAGDLAGQKMVFSRPRK
ncbi:dimethylsulfonioproprionate lyase family protein [Yoonia vestfoldensis]|uniref:dimethylsulfonioproprionate lyase family protein n=1 Tax=Yoonia vestfoldensis TaxID=245188 RepID=UPI0003736669|nr:dimethylsulfonioproprionate lyase family protein [Yoonia vestfoldensis]